MWKRSIIVKLFIRLVEDGGTSADAKPSSYHVMYSAMSLKMLNERGVGCGRGGVRRSCKHGARVWTEIIIMKAKAYLDKSHHETIFPKCSRVRSKVNSPPKLSLTIFTFL